MGNNINLNGNDDAVIDQLELSVLLMHQRDIDISLQSDHNENQQRDIHVNDLMVTEMKLPYNDRDYISPPESLALALVKKLKDKKDKKRKPGFRYSKNGKLSSKAY